MVAIGPPTPPHGRDGVTFAEIAAHYGKAVRYVTESDRWGHHPDWPPPIAKRGRSKEFAPDAVAAFVAAHHSRTPAQLVPDRLYTVAELAEATGLAEATIRADISRDRWPRADDTRDGVNLWRGATIIQDLAPRRSYRRAQPDPGTEGQSS